VLRLRDIAALRSVADLRLTFDRPVCSRDQTFPAKTITFPARDGIRQFCCLSVNCFTYARQDSLHAAIHRAA
jgi:hypothetical protein